MFKSNNKYKDFIIHILIILCALLIYRYFDKFIEAIFILIAVAKPLIFGCIIAYIVNLVLMKIEKLYTLAANKAKGEKRRSRILKFRRAVGIVGSFFVIILFIIFLLYMVIPRIQEVITSTINAMPVLFNALQDFVNEHKNLFPNSAQTIDSININWKELAQKIITFAGNGLYSASMNAFSFISIIGGTLSTALFAFIFSIYLLAGKEHLKTQADKIISIFLKENKKNTLYKILKIFNQSFSSFISGQCIEAVILGLLCCIGMTILQLPYASVIGTLVGSASLIPILGAYIGGTIGFALVFTVSPIQSLYFIIFLVILQQIEGNLIYPRVVGASIGLPGIWVFAAVTIAGGLAGIPGMLIGVPLTAGFYKLYRIFINKRTNKNN